MIDEKQYDFCSEFYIVAKTVELVVDIAGETQQLRIEAHENLPSGTFSTSAYLREHITAQPTYPQSGGKFDQKPHDISVWISYDLPWTSGNSADEVIGRALSFVRERCSR